MQQGFSLGSKPKVAQWSLIRLYDGLRSGARDLSRCQVSGLLTTGRAGQDNISGETGRPKLSPTGDTSAQFEVPGGARQP